MSAEGHTLSAGSSALARQRAIWRQPWQARRMQRGWRQHWVGPGIVTLAVLVLAPFWPAGRPQPALLVMAPVLAAGLAWPLQLLGVPAWASLAAGAVVYAALARRQDPVRLALPLGRAAVNKPARG